MIPLDSSTKYEYPSYITNPGIIMTPLNALDYAYIRIHEYNLNDIDCALIKLGVDKEFCNQYMYAMNEALKFPEFNSYEEELEYHRCG